MNQVGLSLVLQDRAGHIADPSGPTTVLGVGIKTALVGSLTVTGIVAADGSPVAWVINSGSSGLIQAPGAQKGGGNALDYSYSNVADVGRAFVAWLPA